MDRRSFISGVAVAAAAVALPFPASSLAVESAAPAKLLAFAAGSEDAFNWQPFFAASEAEAKAMVLRHFGSDVDGVEFPFEIVRVPRWDKRGQEADVTPADWFRAGMGHCCDRCGDECFSGDGEGSIIMGEVVVCGNCLTVVEQIAAGPDDFEDVLADRIADDGEEDTRAWLVREQAWAAASAIWPKALARAVEYAA